MPVIARINAPLFRRMLTRAVATFPDATKMYHVSAELSRIPSADATPDTTLETLLDQRDSRQLLHICYGGPLQDAAIRKDFFSTLSVHAELHYATVQEHMERHLRLLGVPHRG